MSIKSITTGDLRNMDDKEGLILQGCGGDLNEWVDGINKMFAENDILLEGTRFQQVSSFQNEGLTCLMFPLDDTVKLDIGKLAMWRLASHEVFGGTWLSDYVKLLPGGSVCCEPDFPVEAEEPRR